MEKTIMSVTELVKVVAEKTENTQKDVRAILDAVGVVVKDELAGVTADNAVEVKIFSGLSVLGTYTPSHEARNPKTGDIVTVGEGTKIKGRIGKTLKDAVNA